MGWDTDEPWFMGVTLVFAEDRITCYSTDPVGMCRAIVDRTVPDELVGRAFILRPEFCRAFLAANKRDAVARIIIHDDWTKAVFNSGLVLYATTMSAKEGDPDLDPVKEYTELFEGADYPDTHTIPPNFQDQLVVAQTTLQAQEGLSWDGRIGLSIVDGELYVEAAAGQPGDCTTVKGTSTIGSEFEPYQCRVWSSFIHRVLRRRGDVTEMAISDGDLLFRGRDFTYLVRVDEEYAPPKPDPNSFRQWARRYISQMFDDCGQPWLPLNESVFEIMVAMKTAGFALRSEETIRLVARSLGIESVQVEGPIRWLWWWGSKLQTDDDDEGLDLDLAPSEPEDLALSEPPVPD